MNNLSRNDTGPKETTAPWTKDVLAADQFSEFRAAEVIWEILPPVLISLGCFGNISTIFVMRRIKDHNSSQHAVFMALAVSDLTMLCIATTHGWLRTVLQIDVQLYHVGICRFVEWVVYVSGTTSAWLVTCVTVQRTMAVLWPHRMRGMCTVRRTWIVIATLVLTACACDFHILLGMQISQENICLPSPGLYIYFFDFIFSWVDLCLSSIFPSVCLFVCDIILSVTLFKAVSLSSMAVRVDTGAGSVHSAADNRGKVSSRTTVMVLAISMAFLALTTPVCIYLIWFPYASAEIMQHAEKQAVERLVRALVFQLWYANSAINFFLYCLTGTKFRREFVSWIRCGVKSPSAPSVRETASEAPKRGRHGHAGNNTPSK